jgi:hypothetical protein
MNVNPYEPPRKSSKRAVHTAAQRRTVLIILLILAIPSILIAGFVSCLASAGAVAGMQKNAAEGGHLAFLDLLCPVGLPTGLIVIGLLSYGFYRFVKRANL